MADQDDQKKDAGQHAGGQQGDKQEQPAPKPQVAPKKPGPATTSTPALRVAPR